MTPVDLQPKKKPSVEALWRQFFAEPGSFQDLRPKKEGIAKRPDFKHSESGLVLWLNTAPDWVLKRKEEEPLEAYLQDDQSIPSKVRQLTGTVNMLLFAGLCRTVALARGITACFLPDVDESVTGCIGET